MRPCPRRVWQTAKIDRGLDRFRGTQITVPNSKGGTSMSAFRRIVVAVCASVIVWLGASLAVAQEAAKADEPAPAAAPAEEKPLDRGDNAWMLTSSALVLMMTAPGLAMFYCGLVRKKNVLGVIMQCFFLMGLM